MKTRFLLSGLMAVTALTMTSCDNDEVDISYTQQGPSATGADARGKLVSVLKSENYSPDEFMDAVMPRAVFKALGTWVPDLHPLVETVSRVKLAPQLAKLDQQFRTELGQRLPVHRKWQMESHVFSYITTASNGAEVVLSGRVTFPNNMVDGTDHEVQTLSLFTHPAVAAVQWQPSEEMGLICLRAMQNSAVIEPDLQGFGVDYEKNYLSVLSTAALSRQMADCATAAIKLMAQRGVRLAPDGYTTSWGGSLLAGTTIAFQQYYETQAPDAFRKALNLKSTFVATNIREELSAVMTSLQTSDISSFLMNYTILLRNLNALSPAQARGYRVSDFLSERAMSEPLVINGEKATVYEYVTKVQALYPQIVKSEQLSAQWHVADLVPADMLTAAGAFSPNCPKMGALREILASAGMPQGYKPQLPLYLCQNDNDKFCPQKDFDSYCNILSQGGTNPCVHKGIIPLSGLTLKAGERMGMGTTHFASYAVALLEMSTAETAEEIYNRFNKSNR